MKLHRYRTLLFAACCFALALVAAAPGMAIGATITITTVDELQKIGNDPLFPLDGAYVLGNDIDASGSRVLDNGTGTPQGFKPIGPDSSHIFAGSFDGQGHVIRNLYINRTSADYVGLFGYASGATLKNIGLDNATVSGDEYVGGVAGYFEYGSISSCYSTGKVIGDSDYVGGVVGYAYVASIGFCYNTGTVNGYEEVGGVVGYIEYGDITSCYNTGTVSGYEEIGGVVGYDDYANIIDCHNTAAVIGTYDYVGGVAGYTDYNTISNCYNTGAVSGADDYVGGIVGEDEYTSISDCYNTGAVSAYDEEIGGVVGYQDYGSISNCHNTGMVTGDYYVGGLVGYIEYGGISNCYNTGMVIASDDEVGGLVGYDDYSSINNCYNTGAVIAGNDEAGGLVGYNDYGGITSCYSTGAVTGSDDEIGGLVGYNDGGSITMSFSQGAVIGYTEAGGLVGYNYYGGISNCYATGAVTGGDDYIGGLVGYNYESVINSCYSTGAVSGSTDFGGLVGYNDAGAVNACFWDTQTSGQSTSDGGEGKATAQMKTKATFTDAGWDFTIIWGIIDGQMYPLLSDVSSPSELLVVVSDNYTTTPDTPLTVAAPGVLANDTNLTNDNMTAVLVSGTAHGSLALNPDGSFAYIPDKRFKGMDTFIYKAAVGGQGSAPATVTITVGRKKLCPAVKLYGEKSAEVKLLRTYRDRVLKKAPAGKVAVKLYYKLAPMANTVIDNSPYLGQKARSIIDMLLPSIQRSMQR